MAEDVSLQVQPDLPTRNVTSGVVISPLDQPPEITYSKKGMADDLDDQEPPQQRMNPMGERLYREVGSPWEYQRIIRDYALATELLGASGAAFATAILTTAGTPVPDDMRAFLSEVKAQTGMDLYAALDAGASYLEGKLRDSATMGDGRQYRDVVRTGYRVVGRDLLQAAGIPL